MNVVGLNNKTAVGVLARECSTLTSKIKSVNDVAPNLIPNLSLFMMLICHYNFLIMS